MNGVVAFILAVLLFGSLGNCVMTFTSDEWRREQACQDRALDAGYSGFHAAMDHCMRR